MSFSQNVKNEIISNKNIKKNNKASFVYGMALNSQLFGVDEIILRTSSTIISNTLIDEFSRLLKLNSNDFYTLLDTGDILSIKMNKETSNKIDNYINNIESFIESTQEAAVFLAGAFLVCGNITNPKSSYHLEFISNSDDSEVIFRKVAKILNLNLNEITRRDKTVFYSKDCREIQDILTLMGATKSTLKMVDAELLKDIRNKTNRINNCDTANISKTVSASSFQINNINLLINHYGFKYLPKNIREAAEVRIKNPYAPLSELTEKFPYSISRAGLHQRFAAIAKMADEVRNGIDIQKEKINV